MNHITEKKIRKQANIMLIDDDYSTNYYHKVIIKEAHIAKRLTLCKSADNALNELNHSSPAPDIIFLDINMPKKDGWDFLKEYRKLDKHKRAKIVVMLSSIELPYAIKEVKKQDLDLVNAFNIKPLMVDEVSSFIEQLSYETRDSRPKTTILSVIFLLFVYTYAKVTNTYASSVFTSSINLYLAPRAL